MNETQRSIILKLIHHPTLSFSELLAGARDSNRFAYHLKAIVEKGLVKHEGEKYSLSDEGHKLSSFIEGDTGEQGLFPTFVHGLIVEKEDGMLLFQKRLKNPFYGHWGLISGKINFGLNVVECALHDFTEETGMRAESGTMIGLNEVKTIQDGLVAFHHIIFLVRLYGISGQLIEKTHKGENAWMSVKDYLQTKHLPSDWLNEILKVKGFIILETERALKDGEFTSYGLVSKRII